MSALCFSPLPQNKLLDSVGLFCLGLHLVVCVNFVLFCVGAFCGDLCYCACAESAHFYECREVLLRSHVFL